MQRLGEQLPNIAKLVRIGALAMLERCENDCARRDGGPGLLAELIMQGGPSGASGGTVESLLERERRYGQDIQAWLQANLPDVCDERGRPHYAAVAAVIRLHHRYGKGSLTAKAHGAVIRAAVKQATREERADRAGAAKGGERDG